jgi:hypothetical protein
MNTELIRLLEDASLKLDEVETVLGQVRKITEETTIPTDLLKALAQRHQDAQALFEGQRLNIFTTLVSIALLLPEKNFRMVLPRKSGYDAVCIVPESKRNYIKVWTVVPYKEQLMTVNRFVNSFHDLALVFSKSLIHQIHEAVTNLKRVEGSVETLQEVAKLYQGLAVKLTIFQ